MTWIRWVAKWVTAKAAVKIAECNDVLFDKRQYIIIVRNVRIVTVRTILCCHQACISKNVTPHRFAYVGAP
ncbi:MAG: hypothetical protein VR71_12985 [Roseovarius sp. BRH_c41]|nr:MAG: hypothetical protein VR71_12985 [Roseovarius sp. BRH_c41]